ncbi:unnamed protein product [Notodromas monacha]|uniref:F-box only protein 9 n=1 Tax=Notodromas monacha TaxID=399045 RepID=A0A7R9BLY6_9CRUS|nr:unnamed protein product [Notodromas monacha]CAG0916842.1 unnamed protein product [Notodromas monacha]
MDSVLWSDEDFSESSEDPTSPEKREAELERFRREWKGEIAVSRGVSARASTTKQDLAAELFEKGANEERHGRMYEAIKFYRDAVHLVPDIEQKMAQSAAWAKPDKPEDSQASSASASRSALDNLLHAFEQVHLLDGDAMGEELGVWQVCRREKEVPGGHMSDCPPEVVALILRWVVSRDLDVRSLDVLGEVCRGFYQAARDPEIWRRICHRVFGASCASPEDLGFLSWRDMFFELPHPYFHGCYINRVSYIRHGENSFQDRFYRPWYEVKYYRFLRFFPEGRCLMMNTPDEPQHALHHMKSRNPRLGTVLAGHYRLHGDTVVATLKRVSEAGALNSALVKQINRARRNRVAEERTERTFYLELQMRSVRGRKNMEVAWTRYSVLTYHPERGTGSTTEFEMSLANFPPSRFARVRSFAAVADQPLDDAATCSEFRRFSR